MPLVFPMAFFAAGLPINIDFTALPDGGPPDTLVGATFSVSGGRLTNNPSSGSNLLTNPQLTGVYVSGLAPNQVKNGSPTVAESSVGHGDSQAQEFTAVAFNNRLNFPVVAAVNGAVYLYTGWLNRTNGTGTGTRMRADQAAMRPQNGSAGAAASSLAGSGYAQKKVSFITGSTANITPFSLIETDSSNFDTVIGDDYSLVRLTFADLFDMLREPTQTDVVVRVQPDTIVDQTLSGVVARANANASPSSGLFAFYHWRDPEDFIVVSLYELSGGTYTQKIAEASLTIVSNAWLEIRVSGSTAKLYYNNAQVGTDQSVSVSGTYHGLMITGGNRIKNFSVASN